jgi:dynein heavy chain
MTDRMWQDLMNGLKTNNNVKACCSMEGLYEKLKEANMNLENVEKGLNDYMEKREVYSQGFISYQMHNF